MVPEHMAYDELGCIKCGDVIPKGAEFADYLENGFVCASCCKYL